MHYVVFLTLILSKILDLLWIRPLFFSDACIDKLAQGDQQLRPPIWVACNVTHWDWWTLDFAFFRLEWSRHLMLSRLMDSKILKDHHSVWVFLLINMQMVNIMLEVLDGSSLV